MTKWLYLTAWDEGCYNFQSYRIRNDAQIVNCYTKYHFPDVKNHKTVDFRENS